MQTVDTARLQLRPLGKTDEALYCRLYSDAVLMQHIATPLSREAAQRCFVAVLRQRGGARMVWVIIEREDGAQRGILGMIPESTAAEVGVMLLAEAQARGFAAEVISAIADELFLNPAIRLLWTRHASANTSAGMLMRDLGFEPLLGENLAADEIRWQMTRERWSERHQPAAAVAVPGR